MSKENLGETQKTLLRQMLDEDALAAKSKKLTNNEFERFVNVIDTTRLDPFRRQIHAIVRGGKMTIQTGIDGYRAIAGRTGAYAGNDDYKYDEGLSLAQIVKAKKPPTTATATVYRIVGGHKCAFSASAVYDEYCPKGRNFIWDKMPYFMIGKCAESLALRKGYSDELSGIYTDEEMQQADDKSPTRMIPKEKYAKLKTEEVADVPATPEKPKNAPLKDKHSWLKYLNQQIEKSEWGCFVTPAEKDTLETAYINEGVDLKTFEAMCMGIVKDAKGELIGCEDDKAELDRKGA